MELRLMELTREDLPLTMAWRSIEVVFQGLYSQHVSGEPANWEGATRWFGSRNQDWRSYIIEIEDGDEWRPIGACNVGSLDSWAPELGFFIGEVGLWGRGIGKRVVEMLIERIQKYAVDHNHISGIRTTVLRDNERSVRLLKSLGFTELGPAREGEIWMQRPLYLSNGGTS